MNKKTIVLVLAVLVLTGAAWYSFFYPKVPLSTMPPDSLPQINIDNDKTDAGANGAADVPPVDSGADSGADLNGGNAGMANPASVYCVDQGGKLEIREGEGGQLGVCIMPDGTECDEWEFFRTKKCGGVVGGSGDGAICGRENCYGLDIKCGPNPAEMCTMEYRLGDKCLRYVNCGIVDGACIEIKNAAFDACKSCVQKCETDSANDPQKAFDCESKCD